MSKDDVHVLRQLRSQQTALTNKITHMEERMKDITDEFSDLLHVLADLISDHYAGMDTPGTILRAESILEKMRLKYG